MLCERLDLGQLCIALTDDAADAFLAVFTNGKVTGDKVGPHGDLLDEFPYLGSPHNA